MTAGTAEHLEAGTTALPGRQQQRPRQPRDCILRLAFLFIFMVSDHWNYGNEDKDERDKA
jgi:hypothetical protein